MKQPALPCSARRGGGAGIGSGGVAALAPRLPPLLSLLPPLLLRSGCWAKGHAGHRSRLSGCLAATCFSKGPSGSPGSPFGAGSNLNTRQLGCRAAQSGRRSEGGHTALGARGACRKEPASGCLRSLWGPRPAAARQAPPGRRPQWHTSDWGLRQVPVFSQGCQCTSETSRHG